MSYTYTINLPPSAPHLLTYTLHEVFKDIVNLFLKESLLHTYFMDGCIHFKIYQANYPYTYKVCADI